MVCFNHGRVYPCQRVVFLTSGGLTRLEMSNLRLAKMGACVCFMNCVQLWG